MNDDDFDSLHRYIHCSSSNCWKALVPTSATYDPSCSKTSALAPPLRYLYVILAHTLIGRRESTDVTKQHRKGVLSIDPYMTRLARYFGLLNTAAQPSSLTLIGQMSSQGISSMLHMRMIE
ncbi:hypothetical protein GOBAR_AA05638 [Gossypium barbadense]|uniref:Uncharacterized protein n=1 Tax=Gossypium barbadense TaxID=3634 RepID=A0A2P5YH87_GOSBA|nr:hypothetical protein GOBAR_AA05638 [Gossypium barbadense]